MQKMRIEMEQGTVRMTHVALVSRDGHIDATPASSYEQAIDLLRKRAETWQWEIDPEHPLDRSTARLEQLSALYAHEAANEDSCWVDIAEVWPHGSVSQPQSDLEALVRDYYDAAQIGASMQDPTVDDLQDYDRRMHELMRRAEVLLKLGREGESPHVQA